MSAMPAASPPALELLPETHIVIGLQPPSYPEPLSLNVPIPLAWQDLIALPLLSSVMLSSPAVCRLLICIGSPVFPASSDILLCLY